MREREKMYTINIYDKQTEGEKRLSNNFRVREFACKDGSRQVLIDPALVDVLQQVRDHFGAAVNINSGYRTPDYNRKIKGADNSQHCYGTAADITVRGVQPVDVYRYLDILFPEELGLGKYSTFTHVDVRAGKARW